MGETHGSWDRDSGTAWFASGSRSPRESTGIDVGSGTMIKKLKSATKMGGRIRFNHGFKTGSRTSWGDNMNKMSSTPTSARSFASRAFLSLKSLTHMDGNTFRLATFFVYARPNLRRKKA